MKPLTSNKQDGLPSADLEDLRITDDVTVSDQAEAKLDPLDQITDVFRDLDEFRVQKAGRSSLRDAMKLSDVVAPSKPTFSDTEALTCGVLSTNYANSIISP